MISFGSKLTNVFLTISVVEVSKLHYWTKRIFLYLDI